MKLAKIMKELTETKNLLIIAYTKNEQLRDLNERLRELNARLSKDKKELKEFNMKLLDEKNKRDKEK